MNKRAPKGPVTSRTIATYRRGSSQRSGILPFPWQPRNRHEHPPWLKTTAGLRIGGGSSNLHELEALVERAAVEAQDNWLAPFEGLDALLAQQSSAAGISTYGRKVEREPFVADAAGRWYTTPDGQRFDLERRKTLARVLATMLEARRDEPGRALSVADMLERAWADEKLLPRAGANRVYVAMTTLRKMGLRDILVRTDSGYVLDPDVPLRIIEA